MPIAPYAPSCQPRGSTDITTCTIDTFGKLRELARLKKFHRSSKPDRRTGLPLHSTANQSPARWSGSTEASRRVRIRSRSCAASS